MSSRRAFTLIELLVVIAIIAILAAILFPVFAQAKEAAKKTTTLSNYKQFATAAIIYSNDFDDTFPLGYSFDGTNWRYNYNTSCPNGWRADGVRNVQPRVSQDGLHWANSLAAYIKSAKAYEMNGAPNTVWYTGPTALTPTNVGLSYNGMLHALSTTSIGLPSRVPLFSGMNGKQNMIGRTLTNPALDCSNVGAGCNNSNTDTSSSFNFVWFWDAGISAYSYGTGIIYAYSDSHAKFHNIILNTTQVTDYYDNPFAAGDPTTGVPTSMWGCNFGNGKYESCVFSPNKTQ